MHLKEKVFKDTIADSVTVAEWTKASAGCKFVQLLQTEELEKLFLDEIIVEGRVLKSKLDDILHIFQFLPINIKRDKNKSEALYFVLNSNTRGQPNMNREEMLKNLKNDNDRKHISKLMTLVAIKMEEKFKSMGKAFLFFDVNGDQ